MCQENTMKWKKKKKIKELIKFIKDFSLFIKQCYRITWIVEEIQKVNKVARTKTRRIMLLSKCAVCDSKKLKFIK